MTWQDPLHPSGSGGLPLVLVQPPEPLLDGAVRRAVEIRAGALDREAQVLLQGGAPVAAEAQQLRRRLDESDGARLQPHRLRSARALSAEGGPDHEEDHERALYRDQDSREAQCAIPEAGVGAEAVELFIHREGRSERERPLHRREGDGEVLPVPDSVVGDQVGVAEERDRPVLPGVEDAHEDLAVMREEGAEAIVGPEVAGHSRPVKLQADQLTVEVDDGAWASQLRWMTAEVLAALDREVGEGTVTGLRVRVSTDPK